MHISDAAPPVPHLHGQQIVFRKGGSYVDLSDPVGVGVNDAVGDRLRNGGFDVAQLLHGGVGLGDKGGDEHAGKALIGAPAGEGDFHGVFRLIHTQLSSSISKLPMPATRMTRRMWGGMARSTSFPFNSCIKR